MLIIRKEQMEMLKDRERQGFVERMADYLKKNFPDQTESLGEAGLRAEIHHGMETAEKYRMVSEREVARYIELMFYLGHDFDVNPKTPWAASILNDPFSNAANRLRRLSREAGKHHLVTYPVTSDGR
jgi:hypothetical protein